MKASNRPRPPSFGRLFFYGFRRGSVSRKGSVWKQTASSLEQYERLLKILPVPSIHAKPAVLVACSAN
jgi:hypothetical protein